MGRSSNKRGPDFRILRPDLESSRKACDKPVQQWDPDNETLDMICADLDETVIEETILAWIDPELSPPKKS